MVIVPNRVGQLGNQLFHMAHFAASAIKFGYRVRFDAFQYPLKHFPNINSLSCFQATNTSPSRNRLQSRLFRVLSKTIPESRFHRLYSCHPGPPFIDTGSKEFVQQAKSKIVLCQGFGFRDISSVLDLHGQLVELFQLSDPISEAVDGYMKENRIPQKGDRRHGHQGEEEIVVGFHIRRGDYREFSGGSYFFDDARWIDLIAQTRRLARFRGKEFSGIIFSNEDAHGIIESSEDLVSAPGSVYSDLLMLSRCDYIVAPPSTYSGWVSFIGKVPFLSVDRSTTIEDFKQFESITW